MCVWVYICCILKRVSATDTRMSVNTTRQWLATCLVLTSTVRCLVEECVSTVVTTQRVSTVSCVVTATTDCSVYHSTRRVSANVRAHTHTHTHTTIYTRHNARLLHLWGHRQSQHYLVRLWRSLFTIESAEKLLNLEVKI